MLSRKRERKENFLNSFSLRFITYFYCTLFCKKNPTFFFKQVVERQVESTSGSDNLYNFLKPHKFKFILSSGLEKM